MGILVLKRVILFFKEKVYLLFIQKKNFFYCFFLLEKLEKIKVFFFNRLFFQKLRRIHLIRRIFFKNYARGQIVVEYVLLLLVGIGVASLVITQLVSRDPQNPGFLIARWYDYLKLIASDVPEGMFKWPFL